MTQLIFGVVHGLFTKQRKPVKLISEPNIPVLYIVYKVNNGTSIEGKQISIVPSPTDSKRKKSQLHHKETEKGLPFVCRLHHYNLLVLVDSWTFTKKTFTKRTFTNFSNFSAIYQTDFYQKTKHCEISDIYQILADIYQKYIRLLGAARLP